MPIKIKYNDPRKDPTAGLPEGVTLVPIQSEFKDHYRVFAQNNDYADRTEIGTVKRHPEGHFIIEVEYRNWAVCGWTCEQKSHGLLQIKDTNYAVCSLYNHRLKMLEKGVIKA